MWGGDGLGLEGVRWGLVSGVLTGGCDLERGGRRGEGVLRRERGCWYGSLVGKR